MSGPQKSAAGPEDRCCLNRYDTDGLDIKVTKTELDESSGTVNALLANIPIKEGSRNFRK